MSSAVTDPTYSQPRRTKLPIGATAAAAYGALWTRRDDLLRVAAAPALVAFLLGLAADWRLAADMDLTSPESPQFSYGAFGLLLLTLVPMTLFAVNWTRVLLLGRESVVGLGLRWGVRETFYLLHFVVIVIAATLAGLIVAIPVVVVLIVVGLGLGLVGLPGPGGGMDPAVAASQVGGALGFLLALPIVWVELYVLFRLILALPAVAVDRRGALALAWQSAKGNLLRLFVAYLLVVLPPYLAIVAVQYALGVAGLFHVAPFSAQLINTILGFVAAGAGGCVLAEAYRGLVGLPRSVTAGTST